jgi:energy-coupling factor transport system substrate-specific component
MKKKIIVKNENIQQAPKRMIDMNDSKLLSKDLITIAIFSVVFFVLMRIGSLIAMIFILYPFAPAIQILLCGVVWMYIRAKVPKHFSIFIQCVIMALLIFLTGSLWTIGVGMLAGGALAEIISGIGRHKNFKLCVIAYVVYGLCFNFGVFGIILLARDYWYAYVTRAGIDVEYMEKVIALISWPLLGVSSVAMIVAATLGMFFGRFILKKHSQRAGVL